MGRGGARARLAGTGREHDHRLARLENRLGQRPAVAEVLDVEGDHLRRLVATEVGDEVGDLEVGLVADRCDPGEAEADVGGQPRQLQGYVSTPADQADRPRGRGTEPQIELGAGVRNSPAVGAEHHRAGLSDPLDHRSLAGAALLPAFGEAGRDRHQSAGPRPERVGNGLLEAALGDGENDQLRGLGQLGSGPVGGLPEDLAPLGVDQVDPAAAGAEQGIAGHQVSPLHRVRGGTDDRDRARLVEAPELSPG